MPAAVDEPSPASTPPVASMTPAEAAPITASDEPAAQPDPAPEPAKYAPLFSRVDELELRLQAMERGAAPAAPR